MGTRIRYSTDGTLVYLRSGATKTAISNTDIQKLDDAKNSASFVNSSYVWPYYVFSFPALVTLSKLALFFSHSAGQGNSIRLLVSTDSTDGIDGNWTTILNMSSGAPGGSYNEFSFTPVQCLWVKVEQDIYTNNYFIYGIHFFGTYPTPLLEFWDLAQTAPLNTVDYPQLFNLSNRTDQAQSKNFRIKNTSATAKVYTVAITPVKYGGDSIVSNYFKLSYNGGAKAASVVTASVAPGAFSLPLAVSVDMLIAQNAADGYHYFSIGVTGV